NEGRDIPYLILSHPVVTTPAEAKALHRPIVYVQGNIHAGEVEGKDAMLALSRDLLSARHSVIDSVVLIVVPIYNADGNERFASQSVNRTEQNGPEMVGTRANAQGLDLNRDYVKAEAPETRASLAMFNAWDPDVFVDLHTTDGSYHGYSLTYAPSLNPAAAFGGVYARDSLLLIIRERMLTRRAARTFDYGDFISDDTLSKGWVTFDSRPRFGTNYYGLRGRIAILSEAFSHDPLQLRIATTYHFVQEILSLVAEKAPAILALSARADEQQRAWARGSDAVQMIPIRSELTSTPDTAGVIAETLERTDSASSEPGVKKGYRRTGRYTTVRMPLFVRFSPTLEQVPPSSYALPAGDTAIAARLRMHGLAVEKLASDWTGMVESFVIDSVITAPRAFQGHHETRLKGSWTHTRQTIPAGSFIVKTSQPRGLLGVYLLEPESDDGLVDWNFFDSELARGKTFPVLRMLDTRGSATH
ncbi:MAG: M14 family metallopeptidase, partial [Gemmatimonadota bacterium]|nr:M14 family metallopeptidase [Gemmatimonadota bacterium]